MHQRSFRVWCAFALLAAGHVSADLGWKAGWQPANTWKTDLLAANGLIQLAEYEVFSGQRQANCSLANAAVRRDWYVI